MANRVDLTEPSAKTIGVAVLAGFGAVSYHSGRGWSDSLLTFCSDAAKRLDVPLLVGEGCTDAGAYRYPAIFLEPEFELASTPERAQQALDAARYVTLIGMR